ncbi:MAG: type II secretion system protein GspG [Armatimonadetes bacterium]|nr:type II secretion system protein GspG [Armatimonadota bacterium]
MTRRSNTAPGMTLRDFLLALLILAFLAYRYAERVAQRRQLQRREVTIHRILLVQEGLERYAVDNAGHFPPDKPGLELLIKPPSNVRPRPLRWRGPYVPSAETLLDGWGRPFHYCDKGSGDPPRPYMLWSPGADNSDGGTGMNADVNVWNPDSLVP